MESLIGIILGLLGGGAAGFFTMRTLAAKKAQAAIDDANKTADLTLSEAKLSAQRVTQEAEMKALAAIDKSKIENERIKNEKIQQAQEKFNRFRSEFDSEKSKKMVELKDREIEVVAKEASFKAEFQQMQQTVQRDADDVNKLKAEVEQRDAEVSSIRENLTKQLAIVSKRKEDLDAANELRIKELERVAQLTEQEAKDQLLEAVRGKTENEATIFFASLFAFVCA